MMILNNQAHNQDESDNQDDSLNKCLLYHVRVAN